MKKTTIKAIAAALVMAASVGSSVFALPAAAYEDIQPEKQTVAVMKASNGWKTEGSKKYYYENGQKVTNTKKKIDGKLYLFDKNGAMLKNGKYSYNGNDYYINEDGTIVTHKWVKQGKTKSGRTYMYADGTGKVTAYSLKKPSSYYSGDYILYVNGKKAVIKDLPQGGYNYYMLGNDIVYIRDLSDIGTYSVPLNGKGEHDIDVYAATAPVYDLATGKEKYKSIGIVISGKVADSGNLIDSKGNIYKIQGDFKAPKKCKSVKVGVTYDHIEVNSAGGITNYIVVYNNSGKNIKYITLRLKYHNSVFDYITDDITGKDYVDVRVAGPFYAGDVDEIIAENVFYNKTAFIGGVYGVTIEYSDGTTESLNQWHF